MATQQLPFGPAPPRSATAQAPAVTAAMEAPAAGPAREVFTVSRLNREARAVIERGFGVVWVEGELSNFSTPSSGHWYFSLKDRDAQLRCAMFRARNSAAGFTPRAGQLVLARGRLSLYEPRGEFQFIVEHLEEAGLGALRREFDRLKTRLAAEGLFAAELKRPLPRFPRRIGVITSPTGAAVRDVLHVLARRYPPAAVLVYPTPVQGAAAVPALVETLALVSQRAEVDVVILARGGGSLEDLWAFNDERVARAVRSCSRPVIAGIGHEIDFTIADFVADARAPTPSGAAELATPDRTACLEALARTHARLQACMLRELRSLSQGCRALVTRLQRAHPGVRLQQQAQRLDELESRLASCTRRALRECTRHSSALAQRLHRADPRLRLARQQEQLGTFATRLARSAAGLLERRDARLQLAARALNAVSPLATLTRGYAIVTRTNGAIVTQATSLEAGEQIEARLSVGRVQARVIGTRDD